MAAVILNIADAVVTTLNGAALSQSFTAERSYVPVLAKQSEEGAGVDQLATLKVLVVPRELTSAALHRKARLRNYVVDIGLYKRTSDAVADNDPFMLLVEEMMDLFEGKMLAVPGNDEVTCILAANEPIFAPTQIDEVSAFVSVLSLTFQAPRRLA